MIGPERNVNLIYNLSLYIHISNIKLISQNIAKTSGRNCFISELQTWVALYVLDFIFVDSLLDSHLYVNIIPYIISPLVYKAL
jgi:hypothetical protein